MSDNTETLYRFFDKQDRLLYVGISKHWFERFSQHRAQKEWFSMAVRSTMEHFLTREDARYAEESAIVSEKPIFNVMHNNHLKPSKAAKVATKRKPIKKNIFYVDKSVSGIIKKMASRKVDVAQTIDSLLLLYLQERRIPKCFSGDKFKDLNSIQKKRINIPVNFDVRNKLYHLRNEVGEGEIISNLLMAYAANNYKIPE